MTAGVLESCGNTKRRGPCHAAVAPGGVGLAARRLRGASGDSGAGTALKQAAGFMLTQLSGSRLDLDMYSEYGASAET